jgi:biotin synthase-related radical SAM superfamily protein
MQLTKAVISKELVFPAQIRVSSGSAIALGLLEGMMDAEPTTAYLMTFNEGKCAANCGFCPQARDSQSNAELLSRVSWPAFSASIVIGHIRSAVQSGKIKRVCIQSLNYSQVFDDLCAFVVALKKQVSVPVSVSCQPLNSQNMWSLAKSGVDRIGIALDAATEGIFDKVKGGAVGGLYVWDNEFVLLRTAIGIFGEGKVSTHLIVGLGETEKQAAHLLQSCANMGVLPGLFAFTPIKGTALASRSQPQIDAYRRVQLARFLIVNSVGRFEDMSFDSAGRIVDFGVGKDTLMKAVVSGKPFLTSGCPDCNRPFYNEKPSGPIYNYPRELKTQETDAIKDQLKHFID